MPLEVFQKLKKNQEDQSKKVIITKRTEIKTNEKLQKENFQKINRINMLLFEKMISIQLKKLIKASRI
jgi:hypothetical protein